MLLPVPVVSGVVDELIITVGVDPVRAGGVVPLVTMVIAVDGV